MKNAFGKSLLLVTAAALLGTATVASAQVRTTPTVKAPPVVGGGVIISRGVAKPDLILVYPYDVPCMNGNCALPPTSHLPNTGFCGPWNGGNQQVRLKIANVNATPAAATQVRISYLYSGAGLQSVANVPALASGQTHVVNFNVPAGAWAPGLHSSLHYTIQADSGLVVAESNESNNSATSHCIGPAG